MFVRKKKNRTGTISVVVVDKSRGRFKEIKNFGVVSSDSEADVLCANAREWISTYGGQQILDFDKEHMQEREVEETSRAFSNIDAVFMIQKIPRQCAQSRNGLLRRQGKISV